MRYLKYNRTWVRIPDSPKVAKEVFANFFIGGIKATYFWGNKWNRRDIDVTSNY